MKRHPLTLALTLASLAALAGCTTERHSAVLGNYKVIGGQMGPAATRWEIIKASVAGWEVVGSAQEDDGGVLLLKKRK